MDIKLYRAEGGPVPDVALDKLYVTLTPHLTKICNTNLLIVQPAHQNLQIVTGRCCSSCSAAIDIFSMTVQDSLLHMHAMSTNYKSGQNHAVSTFVMAYQEFCSTFGPMQATSQALYTQLTSQNSAMVVQQSAYRRRKVCVHSSAPLFEHDGTGV